MRHVVKDSGLKYEVSGTYLYIFNTFDSPDGLLKFLSLLLECSRSAISWCPPSTRIFWPSIWPVYSIRIVVKYEVLGERSKRCDNRIMHQHRDYCRYQYCIGYPTLRRRALVWSTDHRRRYLIRCPLTRSFAVFKEELLGSLGCESVA